MKWLLRGALTLLTLLLVAVLVLVMIPSERVARLAADRIEVATGRAVTIAGPVRATLWPRIGVRAEGVEVANADWSQEGPMLSAEALEVGIAPASLFGGAIRIETLDVARARLVLERRADGVGNWEVAGLARAVVADAANAVPVPAGRQAAGREVLIDRAVLSESEVIWIDRPMDRQIRLRAVDLETRLDGLDAPVKIAGSALLGETALELEGSADALRPLLDGALTPVALSVASGGTRVSLDGRADLDPASFEGNVAARSTDRFALLSALGLAVPDLKRGLGMDRVELDATITLAPVGTVHLRDIVAQLDGNRITGALDIDPTGARPRISGTLAADTLDLRGGGGGASAGNGDGSAPIRDARDAEPAGWDRKPIDVTDLFLADGDITLATGHLDFGTGAADELRARIALENGRAVVTLQPLLAYGATVTGEIVVNGRGGLSSRVDLDISGLQIQPVLTAFAGFDRLVGVADMSVNLLGVGDTAQALAESLDGTAQLRIGQGEFLGLDIPGMIRSLDLGYRGEGRKTVFDSLSMSANVTGGVARSDDLSLAAPFLSATGTGSADIGSRTVEYRILPTLREGQDGSGITVPILIEGPWDDPRIRPDLEYLARQRLEIERENLEAEIRAEAEKARAEAEEAGAEAARARTEAEEARARAEAEARRTLGDALDVDGAVLDSREALEDALRKRLQDTLLDLLRDR